MTTYQPEASYGLQDAVPPAYTAAPLVVGPGQALTPAQGWNGPVVVLQQPAPEKTWLAKHSGELVAGFAAGGLVLALLLAVAVVAVAVGLGAISCAIGFYVVKSLMGQQNAK